MSSQIILQQSLEITLSDDDARLYRGMLQTAWDKVANNDGSESALDDLTTHLQTMEVFIRQRTKRPRSDNTLEQLFAQAAAWDDAEHRTTALGDIMMQVAPAYDAKLKAAATLEADALLALLREGKADIQLHQGPDFIPTGPGHLAPAKSDHPEPLKRRTEPRLAWLITGLKEIGVDADDLKIHVRQKDQNKMKLVPHILVEIPRLRSQIAVCDQIGEITFVATDLFELSMWERLKKRELEMVPGITSVRSTNLEGWLNTILAIVQRQESAPKVKVTQDPKRVQMPWTVDLIKETLVACRDPNTGDYPSAEWGLIVDGPLANGKRTWVTLASTIGKLWARNPDGSFKHSGANGLTRETCPYRGLGELKDAFGFGLMEYTVADIVASLKACRDPETDEYPVQKAGLITAGPLADGRRTWASVEKTVAGLWLKKPDGSFRYTKINGLTRQTCPYKNMGELKMGEKLVEETTAYTVDNIVASLKACCDPKTGDCPSADWGLVIGGPLADGKRNWGAVNATLGRLWERNPDGSFKLDSSNGLTRDTCPYKGLGELKEAFSLGPKLYTLADIVASLKACRDPETNKFPTQETGLITAGPLADGKRSWHLINGGLSNLWQTKSDGSFRVGSSNGLLRETCPYKGLGEIKHAYGLKPGPWKVDIELLLGAPEHDL